MQIWDILSIFNPTRMNHIEQGIYDADLREGGTIGGNLYVDNRNGTASQVGASELLIGNGIAQGTAENSQGIIRLYSNTAYRAVISAPNLTAGRTFSFPDMAGTIGLVDKVTILAESTGSKTHAQHIAVLKAVWDTLSTDQKMKCLIKRANQIYVPTSIASSTGRFSSVEISNQKFYVEMIRMSDTTFTILDGTTYTDASSLTVNQAYTLYLPL